MISRVIALFAFMARLVFRISRVKAALLRLREKSPNESFFALSSLLAEMRSELPPDDDINASFPHLSQIDAVLRHMEENNMLMYRDNLIIFL
jgi:hypothetical protein